jgi:hypothetical protein
MTDQNNAAQAAGKILTYLGFAQAMGMEPGVDHRRDHIQSLIESTLLSKLRAEGVQAGDERAAMVARVDAAMVEMRNITPPLRRSECEQLIRAALASAPVADAMLVKASNTDTRDVDVEVHAFGSIFYDHGPNLAEALGRLAQRVARWRNMPAPSLASAPVADMGIPMSLPPLPPRFSVWKDPDEDCGAWGQPDRDVFTADQMWEYARAARASAPVAGEALQVATRAMQMIRRSKLDPFERQQHDKLVQDFAALHERQNAAPQGCKACDMRQRITAHITFDQLAAVHGEEATAKWIAGRQAAAPQASETGARAACLRRQRNGSEWGHWIPGTVEDGERVTGLRSWQVRWLVDAAPQASEAVRILFPAHLRKMWSGGEVQAWLDNHQGITPPTASAKGSLERYRNWRAEQAEADKDGVSSEGRQ